jgi:hypothetical protein
VAVIPLLPQALLVSISEPGGQGTGQSQPEGGELGLRRNAAHTIVHGSPPLLHIIATKGLSDVPVLRSHSMPTELRVSVEAKRWVFLK